jgi:signal transduction histidine kinase
MSTRSNAALATAGAAVLAVAPLVGWRTGHLAEASRGLPQSVAFLATGALAATARPDHRGARRLLLIGLVMAVGFPAGTAYSAYLLHRPTPPWGWAAVLALQMLDLAQGAALLALLAIFPDGEYHRPYERRVVRLGPIYIAVVALLAVSTSATLTFPGAWIWGDQVSAANPLAVGAQLFGRTAQVAYQAGFVVMLLASVTLLALRFKRFGPLERRQIAWPLYGTVVAGAWGAAMGALSSWNHTLPDGVLYLLYAPAALAVPVSIAIGMLRHRLLDIDFVIRRSVIYGVLWVLIAAAYVGLTLAFGVAVGGRVPLETAVALTIAATLVAAPLRQRLERVADRLVYGRRLSGYELIAALGSRLEAISGVEDVAGTVAAAVQTGLGARWARVVLEDAGRGLVGAAGSQDGTSLPALSVPLVRGAETIGAIECGPKREGRYSDADLGLLRTLGRQAALAVHNSWLAGQLAQQIDDLAASRARIVHAEDAGRRRLERDIHDGVQQEVVALLARLGLARNQLRRDPTLAERTLREAQRDGRRALLSLQDVARGIHPPLLRDRGLVEALSERTSRLTLPVEVCGKGLNGDRFAADVEGAAYFVVTEAVANSLKHARASRVWVDLSHHEGELQVSVRDDGAGFDPTTAARRGLVGLQDRVEALGGRLTVSSHPGSGTTLQARIPGGPRD